LRTIRYYESHTMINGKSHTIRHRDTMKATQDGETMASTHDGNTMTARKRDKVTTIINLFEYISI